MHPPRDFDAGSEPICLAFIVVLIVAVVMTAAPVLAQPQYTITDLTNLAAPLGVLQCEGTAINESGQVVGVEVVSSFITRAIFWDSDGTPMLPRELTASDNSTWTHGLNNNGLIAGVSEEVTIEMQGQLLIIHIDDKGVVWPGPDPTGLATLVTGGDPIDLHRCSDVNDNNVSVGWGRPAGQTTGSMGWLLDNGIVTDLGAMTQPVTLNHQGQVVGYSFGSQSKAYVWDNGILTNLHNHASITGVTSRAWGVNEAGLIVGEAQFHISQPESPAMWQNGVPVNLLVNMFGRPQGISSAVNNHDDIVGWVNDLDNLNVGAEAFLLQNGQFHRLIDLIPPGGGWSDLIVAWDINDRGQIVGGGRRFNQLGHGFLLTPVPVPGDLNCNGVTDLDDVPAFVLALTDPAAYPAAHPGCDIMLADLNGDGGNDGADIAPFMAAVLAP